MDQPRGIFCNKLDIYTDKLVFIRKEGTLGRKDAAALFFRHIYRIFRDYFTADFAANGIHHRVGNGRTFPKFQSREPVWPDVGRGDIFSCATVFITLFISKIARGIKTTISRATIKFKPQAAAFKF